MNPATFLKNAERIIAGYGYKRDLDFSIADLMTEDGSAMTAAVTEVGADLLDTGTKALVCFCDDDLEVGPILGFVLPRDYSANDDYLRVAFLVSTDAAGTDSFTIDGALYRKRAGAALSADLGPVIASGAVPLTVAGAAWREVNCDGLGNQGGDCMSFHMVNTAHTTDGLIIYGVRVTIKSSFVFDDQDDR